jgi:hypothetical protein
VINFNGCKQRELHIVHPQRALDQRIARNAHYLDRDQSRLRSRREISLQFPPAAGAQQVFGTRQYLIAIIILHHNTNRRDAGLKSAVLRTRAEDQYTPKAKDYPPLPKMRRYAFPALKVTEPLARGVTPSSA